MPTHSYPLGSVLRSFRGFYYHYGVYVGRGRVVHFAAIGKNELDPATADIVETTFVKFAKGDPVAVDTQEKATFESEEIVRRAQSAVHTKKGTYNLVTNNCEHFANWCRCGKLVSHQQEVVDKVVDALLASYPMLKGFKDAILQASHDAKASLYGEPKKKLSRTKPSAPLLSGEDGDD